MPVLARNPDGTFNLRDYSKTQTVIELTRRIKGLGIDLDRYFINITDYWDGPPKGFKFVCLDNRLTQDLCSQLDRSSRIAKDALPSQMGQDGASWREISNSDSLHIIWLQGSPSDSSAPPRSARGPKPVSMVQRKDHPIVTSYFNIHLDTVSICRTANEGGTCELDWINVPAHIWRDLWHKT